MKKRKREITHLIRIFDDGEAQLLQGKALKAYLERLRIIEMMLDDYEVTDRDIDPFKYLWIPIEPFKMNPKKKPKAGK